MISSGVSYKSLTPNIDQINSDFYPLLMKMITGNGLVERLAAINVSKGTKTVTLNDALPDRPEATRGALLYHIHRRQRRRA